MFTAYVYSKCSSECSVDRLSSYPLLLTIERSYYYDVLYTGQRQVQENNLAFMIQYKLKKLRFLYNIYLDFPDWFAINYHAWTQVTFNFYTLTVGNSIV